MNWLNYHHLYYFRTIATEGSISKASQKLRLGQPTLSTQLRQFEQNLGHTLFERKNRSLILTEAGRTALEYANEIFRLGEEMVEALSDRLVKNRIHVQIGALDSVPKKIVSLLIQGAYEAGDCNVSILEGKGNDLFQELFDHRIDLIVSNFPPAVSEHRKGIFARSMARLPIVICGTKKYQHCRKEFPQSLNNVPFILPTVHSKLRHDLEHFFKKEQIHIGSVIDSQDTSLQILLASSGIGLVALPEIVADELITEKKLISIGPLKDLYEEIWLVSASRRIDNPIAAKLVKNFHLT